MALARGFEPKTDLTPEEKVKAAYFHLVVGWSQHDIANWCCVNSARVNDAVQAVRRAVEWPESNIQRHPQHYAQCQGQLRSMGGG